MTGNSAYTGGMANARRTRLGAGWTPRHRTPSRASTEVTEGPVANDRRSRAEDDRPSGGEILTVPPGTDRLGGAPATRAVRGAADRVTRLDRVEQTRGRFAGPPLTPRTAVIWSVLARRAGPARPTPR